VGHHGAAHAQVQNRLGDSRGPAGCGIGARRCRRRAEIAKVEDLGPPGSRRDASASDVSGCEGRSSRPGAPRQLPVISTWSPARSGGQSTTRMPTDAAGASA
jgi:hypothetical protein